MIQINQKIVIFYGKSLVVVNDITKNNEIYTTYEKYGQDIDNHNYKFTFSYVVSNNIITKSLKLY